MASINSAISAYRNAASIVKSSEEDNSSSGSGSTGSAFSGLVANSMQGSISSLRGAEKAAMGSLLKNTDITDVVTAVSKAENTLRTVVAVRDRLVSAWMDMQKMPI